MDKDDTLLKITIPEVGRLMLGPVSRVGSLNHEDLHSLSLGKSLHPKS